MYPPYLTPAFLSENLSSEGNSAGKLREPPAVTRIIGGFPNKRHNLSGSPRSPTAIPEGWPDAVFVNVTVPIRKVGNVGANVVARSAIAVGRGERGASFRDQTAFD